MNGKTVLAKLRAAGWEIHSIRGSHHILNKGGAKVSVPVHGTQDMKPGTLAAIARQAGVTLK
jgi:predicted RNA binding protein YcfA (HicA-like mRNA interferase family)